MQRLIGLLVMLGLSACSARIEQLEQETKSDLRDLRSIQAEQTATINELRAELRQLTGKVEELQFGVQGKAQEIERSLARLGTRVPPPPGVPEDLLTADQERISSIQGEAAAMFKTALGQLRAGDFEGALANFEQFATQNPGTAFTDNALFWQGIAQSKIGRYDRAVIAFSDVFQTYPAEDMVAPALYFLAEAFQKSGSNEDAVLTMQKLIDEHPRSAFAARAKREIGALKRRR